LGKKKKQLTFTANNLLTY